MENTTDLPFFLLLLLCLPEDASPELVQHEWHEYLAVLHPVGEGVRQWQQFPFLAYTHQLINPVPVLLSVSGSSFYQIFYHTVSGSHAKDVIILSDSAVDPPFPQR